MSKPVSDLLKWRRVPCLGCQQVVKRARDSWTEIIGTRSGGWLGAMPMKAGTTFADSYPPPSDAVLELLGVAHRECAKWAINRIRKGMVRFPDRLPTLFFEEIADGEPGPDLHLPSAIGTCPFCNAFGEPMTDEHIFPKWLLQEMVTRGATFRRGNRLTTAIIGPTTPVCHDCNTTWLATLENDISQILRKMFDFAYELPPEDQARLALWAAKIAILVDAASTTRLVPRGFGHDLKIQRQPHQGMYVWLAAYGGPSGGLTTIPWLIMSEEAGDSESVIAYCLTVSIFKVAFQVLIPFSSGDLASLEDFHGSVVPLWPAQRSDIAWPPPYRFDEASVRALACRIYDNREPVVMEVAMEQAIRVRPDLPEQLSD
jgi:hypothetical protein